MNVKQNILRVIGELDAAIFSHTQWLKRLHRSLLGRQIENADDLCHDAHRSCKFGVWFNDEKNDFMRNDPGFLLIDTLHAEMHAKACQMLVNLQADNQVSLSIYDDFIDSANHFRQHVREIQSELIGKVCLVDHLTGAWNRYAMDQLLAREIERMQRTGHPCSLSMMDLDHFKDVNDLYGHEAGDIVLQKVVKQVTGCLRKYDSLARFGGEEFLICLPNTGGHAARLVLDRCREGLAALEIGVGRGKSIHVTASFGIALMQPDLLVEDVIQAADHALLTAKAEGRNRVVQASCFSEIDS